MRREYLVVVEKQMRARIPPDVPVMVEVGTQPPSEVRYEAKLPYNILILITNGRIRRKFIHITRRKTGIYIARGHEGGFHESYHADGKRHWKGSGINEETGLEEDFGYDLPSGPPLDKVTGCVTLQNATTVVANRSLRGYARFKERDGPYDKIVCLDSRSLSEAVSYDVMLVEPFRHGKIPFITTWPLYFQLFTRCIPWIALLIYEQWPEGQQRMPNLEGS
jgi:hypothetical protein